MSQLFASGGKIIEASASASILPMNIQGLFALGLTDLISLLAKGLSRVFSSITIRKHQFFVKYLEINLPKETKDLFSKNYKGLMKEFEDDKNRWKDMQCSWIGRFITVKMTILLKAISRFSANSINLSMAFFIGLELKNLEICIMTQKTPNN